MWCGFTSRSQRTHEAWWSASCINRGSLCTSVTTLIIFFTAIWWSSTHHGKFLATYSISVPPLWDLMWKNEGLICEHSSLSFPLENLACIMTWPPAVLPGSYFTGTMKTKPPSVKSHNWLWSFYIYLFNGTEYPHQTLSLPPRVYWAVFVVWPQCEGEKCSSVTSFGMYAT